MINNLILNNKIKNKLKKQQSKKSEFTRLTLHLHMKSRYKN